MDGQTDQMDGYIGQTHKQNSNMQFHRWIDRIGHAERLTVD